MLNREVITGEVIAYKNYLSSRAKATSTVLTPEATACTFNPEVLYGANSGYRMVE
jgi:hypothetical protein